LDHPLVEFIGEIGEEEKGQLLGNAYALLFPIDWSEPFGLVMIESLACGTPVIAYRNGSVPEILSDGRTGFIVGSVEAQSTLWKTFRIWTDDIAGRYLRNDSRCRGWRVII
jgi:glycosyltransferase involved in cell wall biosynthesis